MDLNSLKTQAIEEINKSSELKDLNEAYRKYLGREGEIGKILKSLKDMAEEERRNIGKEANELKAFLEKQINDKKSVFLNSAKKKAGSFDISIPGRKARTGHLHPLTLVKRQIEQIFQEMGFSIVLGPEMETEWYNFDALNIPKDHPARDMWDTFWLKNSKNLLRTHTSPVQIRYMERNNPPIKIIAPGRIFRHEATDASHEINFYQVEGLMIDKEISASNFKAIIQEFFSRFFGKVVEARLRPSFFPFTEPSFEVDMSCLVCEGTGCSTCSGTGWIEVMGAGMVHPNVLKAGGIAPKDWQGFAFGMGMDRLAMMKYKINDVRLFYSGDLRFLNQF